MNKKKFAALMLVAALTTSSMTAFAADASATPAPKPTPSSTTSEGTSTVVDTSTVYSVVFPTDNALNFSVDPQGLLNIDKGSSVGVDELVGAGAIVSADGAGALIKNQSSADIVVTAKLSIKSDADSQAVLVDTVAKVEPAAPAEGSSDPDNSKANNMLLAVIPGTAKISAIADYTASTTVVPVMAETADDGSASTDIKFLLNAADYVIAKKADGSAEFKLADGADNYDAVSFKLGGQVNTKADWTGFNGKKFTVTAVYAIDDADGTETARTDAYGLIAEDTAVIKNYTGIVTGPKVTLAADGTLTVTNLTGSANLANGAADIQLGVDGKMYVVANSAVTWDTANWTAANGGTLIIKLSNQYNVYNGKTTSVSIALSDDTTITCTGVLNLPTE